MNCAALRPAVTKSVDCGSNSEARLPITWREDDFVVVRRQHRFAKGAYGVLAKVRRDVTDPQSTLARKQQAAGRKLAIQ